MYSMLISGPSPAGQISVAEATRSGWLSARSRRDRAAQRMADQMRARDPLGVQEVDHRRRQRASVAGAHILARAAMARQVDGVGGVLLGQRRLIEHASC